MNLKNMKRVITNWFSKPLYPIMIAAYPVLALLSSNTGQIQPEAGIRSLLVSVVFGGVLFFVIWLLIRQAHKAAFLSTLWLALFFTFGHNLAGNWLGRAFCPGLDLGNPPKVDLRFVSLDD